MRVRLEDLSLLDWDDAEAVAVATNRVFDEVLQTDGMLWSLIEDLRRDEHLMGLSQHNQEDDKLVLYDGGHFRLRMHLFQKGRADNPHSHRFMMSVRLLDGCYRHAVYGREDDLLQLDGQPLRPTVVRDERAGGGYVLDDASVHSVAMAPTAVSLVLRGPIVKERAVGLNAQHQVAYKYGAAQEDPAYLSQVEMTPERLNTIVAELHALHIV